jgi:hypothetical protein
LGERDRIFNRNRGGQVEGLAESKKIDVASPEYLTQVLLADFLDEPSRELIPRLQDRYPGRDGGFYAPIINGVRSTIEEVIGGLQKLGKGEPSPTALDRYSFAWRFLKRADVLVRKTKKTDIPAISRLEHAEKTFSSILPVPLQTPLLEALLRHLRLGISAEYLHHYSAFRWAPKPIKLPNPFGHIDKNRNPDLLRILIWWCVRARKEEYVEVRPHEPVRIEFAYVVEEIISDLKHWAGTDIEDFPDLTGEVERELNSWLAYSKLDHAGEDSSLGQSSEFARAFVKHNELTTKLRIRRAPVHGQHDELVKQLQSQLRQYIEENRQLEERLRVMQTSTPVSSQPITDSDATLLQFVEVREVLKIVDTKYAFDTLNAVQFGDDTHLTLKSFVGHLFYALRKRGFAEYPAEDEFDLSYESSGLYDCDGFEVEPTSTVRVKVSRKGWAFSSRGRWLPVRRARVVPVRYNGRGE